MNSKSQRPRDCQPFEKVATFKDKLVASLVENIDSSDLEKVWGGPVPANASKRFVIRNFTLQLKEYLRKRFTVS